MKDGEEVVSEGERKRQQLDQMPFWFSPLTSSLTFSKSRAKSGWRGADKATGG